MSQEYRRLDYITTRERDTPLQRAMFGKFDRDEHFTSAQTRAAAAGATAIKNCLPWYSCVTLQHSLHDELLMGQPWEDYSRRYRPAPMGEVVRLEHVLESLVEQCSNICDDYGYQKGSASVLTFDTGSASAGHVNIKTEKKFRETMRNRIAGDGRINIKLENIGKSQQQQQQQQQPKTSASYYRITPLTKKRPSLNVAERDKVIVNLMDDVNMTNSQNENEAASASAAPDTPTSPVNNNSDSSSVKYKRNINKFKPFHLVSGPAEGWHSGVPQMRVWNWIRQSCLDTYGPEERDLIDRRSEAMFPLWVRSSFRRATRPWLLHGLSEETGRYTWYPLNLTSLLPQYRHQEAELLADYTVYCTIVSRVSFLDHLIETDRNLPIEIARQAALWLDSHQMMMLHMEQTELYSDRQIHGSISQWQGYNPELHQMASDGGGDWLDEMLDSMGREDCMPGAGGGGGVLTHYQCYEPSLQHVMHQGELPDLTILMHQIEWWNEHCEGDDETLDIDLRSMADLFRKAMPHPQQSRSMHNICSRRVMAHPRIAEFFRRFIMCSLGGLYEDINSRVLGCFYVRHELYRWLMYWPASPANIATWLNGFECTDAQQTASIKTQKGRKCAQYYDSDAYSPYSVKPSALVGSNDSHVKSGRINMTNFCQFLINEYIILLTETWTGMKHALCATKWYVLVRDTYIQGMDRMRSMLNQWFVSRQDYDRERQFAGDAMLRARRVTLFSEHLTSASPTAKLRVHAYDYPPLDAFNDGQSYLMRLVRDYAPWLRWDYMRESADACLGREHGAYGNFFREQIMPSGTLGCLLFNARFMILCEAILFRCRQYALKFSNRLMQQNFLDCVLSQMTKVQVDYFNPMTRPQKQELGLLTSNGPDACDPPEEDCRIISAVVQYHVHDLKRIPSYEWMTLVFNLPLYPVFMLRVAEHYYGGEVFHKPLVNTVGTIARTYPRVFFYLKRFLLTLRQELRHGLMQLPDNIMERQIRALVKHHEADPDDLQHLDYLSTVYFCAHHGEIKHEMIDSDLTGSVANNITNKQTQAAAVEAGLATSATSTSTPTSTTTTTPATPTLLADTHYGTTKIITDPYTGRMYCDKQLTGLTLLWSNSTTASPDAASNKKGGGGGGGANIDKNDAARRVYAQYDNKVRMYHCFNDELKQVSLLGKMLRLDNRLYMLCPQCGEVTQMDASKFDTPRGFMCKRCSIKYRNKQLIRSLMKKNRAGGTGISALLPEDEVCYCCSTFNSDVKSRQMTTYRVLDDLKYPPEFREIRLCSVHNRAFLREAPDAILLSNVALALSNRLRAVAQSRTEDVVETRRSSVAMVPCHNEDIFIRNMMRSGTLMNKAKARS